MQFKLNALALATATAIGFGTVHAADFPTQTDKFPTSNTQYTKNVVLPGYGDITTDLTISGNGSNTLTIADNKERGNGATLSVTGGTTAFNSFDSKHPIAFW